MREPARPPLEIPGFPLRPGRAAFSRRVRLRLAVGLALCVGLAVAAGLTLATSSKAPSRVVTIPAIDRDASPALIRAAEAVGFRPLGQGLGVGGIEDGPASAGGAAPSWLLPVGATAPPFALRTPAGKLVSLASFRGKALLLEFFATWCPHCAAEAPHLARLAAGMSTSRFAFAAIDANGGDAPSVLAFHVYFGLAFPALLDPGGQAATFPAHGSPGPVSLAYQARAYPTFYVIDPNGRIAWRGVGEQPDELLVQQLDRAVA
ncbi:MAG: TlpA disulfide reductase family protein [Actinomycetes bacterium]